jgi:hypothetical protein
MARLIQIRIELSPEEYAAAKQLAGSPANVSPFLKRMIAENLDEWALTSSSAERTTKQP